MTLAAVGTCQESTVICGWVLSTVGSPHPWVLHPQIQPTTEQIYLEKMSASVLNMYRHLTTICIAFALY